MPPNTAAVKALMPGMEPVVGCRIGDVGAQQHTGNGRQSGADGKGHGNGAVDVDAHELGRAPDPRSTARMALPIWYLVVNHGQPQHDDDAGGDGTEHLVGDHELSASQTQRLEANDAGKVLGRRQTRSAAPRSAGSS